MPPETIPYDERVKWFHEARFGMFIHWGLYSILGRGEWAMLNERIPAADYAKLAGRFNPKKFDADAWAGLAVEAGMKYAVLTTRHHEGFCLFDSQVSEFTSAKTAARRDFVAEYVAACRKAGLKIGFYYSLMDWRFPGYFAPEKLPDSAEAMVQQYHAQVRELMTNYGKIDVLWYDGHWMNHDPQRSQEALAKFWRSKDVNAMVRQLQPHILINNRSGIQEDLDTPEQHVTASQPGRAWESCMTMGDACGWGYIRDNANYKTTRQLLQNLVLAARDGGNYLLNVGPKPDGSIRKKERVRLRALGKWMDINAEAIRNTGRSPYTWGAGLIGELTVRGKTGYLVIFRWPGREAVLPDCGVRALSATFLTTGKKVAFHHEHNGRLVFTGLPKNPPAALATTIKIEFEKPPTQIIHKHPEAWIEGKGPRIA